MRERRPRICLFYRSFGDVPKEAPANQGPPRTRFCLSCQAEFHACSRLRLSTRRASRASRRATMSSIARSLSPATSAATSAVSVRRSGVIDLARAAPPFLPSALVTRVFPVVLCAPSTSPVHGTGSRPYRCSHALRQAHHETSERRERPSSPSIFQTKPINPNSL